MTPSRGSWAVAASILLLAACGPAAERVQEPGRGGEPAPEAVQDAPPPAAPAAAPQHGRSTVEELVADLVQGFQHGNRNELLSLFPPESVMAEALVCPQGNILAEEVRENLEDLEEALIELANVKLELVGIAPRKGKTETFPAGALVEDGCTAGIELTVREVVVTVRITSSGVAEEETDTFVVLQVGGGGPWYLVGPD